MIKLSIHYIGHEQFMLLTYHLIAFLYTRISGQEKNVLRMKSNLSKVVTCNERLQDQHLISAERMYLITAVSPNCKDFKRYTTCIGREFSAMDAIVQN